MKVGLAAPPYHARGIAVRAAETGALRPM